MIKWPWGSGKDKEAQAELRIAAKRQQIRIANTECRVIALHQVRITPDDLRKKMVKDPSWTSLPWDYLLELVGRLYIFDVWISDAGAAPMFLSDITQDNDEGQAPFCEVYFDETGRNQLFTELEPWKRQPPPGATYPCRLRFFLHLVDPKATLDIANRHLELPDPTPLPTWLEDVMPYQPPN